jgi:hypothetical protein
MKRKPSPPKYRNLTARGGVSTEAAREERHGA